MIIYPAIDIRGGRCVRLTEGRFDAETVFADDPAEMAAKWAACGAEWLHLVDLDGALRFGEGVIVVTTRRLLALAPGQNDWQTWDIAPHLVLRMGDHAGVGTLELHDAQQRLALWRFTLGAQAQALLLIQRFEQVAQSAAGAQSAVPEEARCPVCNAELPPDSEECPACARAQAPQPSTWVLLRLWRFAHPYRGQLAAGFALTLASTAATLVPPYLTIPLMDEILIPF